MRASAECKPGAALGAKIYLAAGLEAGLLPRVSGGVIEELSLWTRGASPAAKWCAPRTRRHVLGHIPQKTETAGELQFTGRLRLRILSHLP
jgi:hypothetical protein